MLLLNEFAKSYHSSCHLLPHNSFAAYSNMPRKKPNAIQRCAACRIPTVTEAVNGVAKGTASFSGCFICNALGLLCFICKAILSLRVVLQDY